VNSVAVTLLLLLRLRAGPQDLPSSWALTGLLLVSYTALGIFTGQSLGDEDAVARTLLTNVLQIVAVAALLRLRKFPERLAQTLSALTGAGIILGALVFLLLSQAHIESMRPLLVIAWFGIVIWSRVIDAHIYRHALSVSMSRGLLVAVLLLAASYMLVRELF
jgi:uncharacterized membrane protein YfcA